MKDFFAGGVASPAEPSAGDRDVVAAASYGAPSAAPLRQETRAPSQGTFSPRTPEDARIAVYDAPGTPPRVEEIVSCETAEYISRLATRTYELSHSLGGDIAYSVISEVVENYIHAEFRCPVVTILDSGHTIRFSDQGPGFADSLRALEPGYTTASGEMRRYIRGVGSGLPLVREYLSFAGGSVTIDDNLGAGAVVTLRSSRPDSPRIAEMSSSEVRDSAHAAAPLRERAGRGNDVVVSGSAHRQGAVGAEADLLALQPASYPAPGGSGARLTHRQKTVLALVMDVGTAGPSLVSRELKVGLSTAYRDLSQLESLGLIRSDDTGKRSLTHEGSVFLESLLDPSRY